MVALAPVGCCRFLLLLLGGGCEASELLVTQSLRETETVLDGFPRRGGAGSRGVRYGHCESLGADREFARLVAWSLSRMLFGQVAEALMVALLSAGSVSEFWNVGECNQTHSWEGLRHKNCTTTSKRSVAASFSLAGGRNWSPPSADIKHRGCMK